MASVPEANDKKIYQSNNNKLYVNQILEQNREEVLRAVDGFESELKALKGALLDKKTSELIARLERGKLFRESL